MAVRGSRSSLARQSLPQPHATERRSTAVNLVLVGRLTADPDARPITVAGDERTVPTLALAVPAGGDCNASPLYIVAAVWGAAAQACATYLRRGRRVALTDRLDLPGWTAHDGTTGRVHCILHHVAG